MRQLSITQKLGFSFGLMILLLLGTVIYIYMSFIRITEMNTTLEKINHTNVFITEKEVDHLKWVNAVYASLVSDKELNVELNYRNCGLGRWLYGDSEKDETIQTLVGKLIEPHIHLHQSAVKMKELLKGQRTRAQALAVFENETLVALKQVQDLLHQVTDYSRKTHRTVTEEFHGSIGRIKQIIVVMAVIGMFLAVGLTLLVVRNLKFSLIRIVSMTGEVTQASDTLSGSSQAQSSSVEEIMASLEELVSSIQDVAGNANDVSNSAHSSSEKAKSGGEAVQRAIDSMQQISESSVQMAEIIGVISDIAEQTNLLALNAAIEAARAGDHGKGFAVVADEVRKLAERSAKAALEITQLIKESGARVEDGSKLSQDAGEMLQTIIKHVNQTAEMVEQISAATEEQAATSNTISDRMDQISATVEENASSSEELSASAQNMKNEIQLIISGKTDLEEPRLLTAGLHTVKAQRPVAKPVLQEKLEAVPQTSVSKGKDNYLDW
ncbi:MAG: hypothetical protein GY866_16415 [Proteobacteria bacterium]|nr:hypothetical protein [Pseudomonadota bacterium]